MTNITFKYSSLLKIIGWIVILSIITILALYNVFTPFITLVTILVLSTAIILSITTNQVIKFFTLAIHFIKSIILYFLYFYSDYIIFPDARNYINTLQNISNSGSYGFQNMVDIAQTLHVGFYYFYIFIFDFFGNDLAILLVNTLLISVSAILFYKIVEQRFSKKIAFSTFILFSLSANIFLFGSFILKDPIVIFLTVLSLFFYLNKNKMLLAILIGVFLVTVRIYAGFAVILAILIDFLIFSKISRRRKIFTSIGLFILFIIFSSSPIAQNYLGISSSFVSGTTLIGLLTAIPTALVKFFFAPLPWNILDSGNIYRILFFDSIIMLILSFGLLAFVIKWLRFKSLRQKYYIFLVPILIHAVALGVEYGGDSTRQRSGIFIFVILTFMIGLLYKKRALK